MPNQTRPCVLVIRDGWGCNPDKAWNHANAVHLARTPVDDRLMRTYPHVQISTAGEEVGLPNGVTGNSEVGHQNIGAGRIVNQELMRITHAIRDGSFFENDALRRSIEAAAISGGKLHLMGLCSSAGVHSVLEHCYALLELACRMDFPGDRVFVHCFGDGRDSQPTSGADYVRELEAVLAERGAGQIASVVGRYYAMDRDLRWDRTQRAYDLLTAGKGCRASSAEGAFRTYYDHPTTKDLFGDEFVEPTVIVDDDGCPKATISSGDSVIFFNFRGDRPRQLTRAFTLDVFPFDGQDKTGRTCRMGFDRAERPKTHFCTLTEYESNLSVNVAYTKPEKMVNTLGAVLSQQHLRQFRIAETEKFPHVTFFFNDYLEEAFEGEERFLVASPREVSTYDQKPEMSAREVTRELIKRIDLQRDDFVLVNYANPDMVGHTGNLDAAIRAVEVVDECVGQVVDRVLAHGGCLIVTADHGNCEQMIDIETGGPHTAHTHYDVECIVVSEAQTDLHLRQGGRLADIAPTVLEVMNISQPKEMQGHSLIEP